MKVEEVTFIHEALPVENPAVVESETRGQKDNAKWFDMRRNIISSSNFWRVCKLKDNMSQEKMVRELVNKKNISHIPTAKYGIDNKSNAASMYANYMQIICSPCKFWIVEW